MHGMYATLQHHTRLPSQDMGGYSSREGNLPKYYLGRYSLWTSSPETVAARGSTLHTHAAYMPRTAGKQAPGAATTRRCNDQALQRPGAPRYHHPRQAKPSVVLHRVAAPRASNCGLLRHCAVANDTYRVAAAANTQPSFEPETPNPAQQTTAHQHTATAGGRAACARQHQIPLSVMHTTVLLLYIQVTQPSCAPAR